MWVSSSTLPSFISTVFFTSHAVAWRDFQESFTQMSRDFQHLPMIFCFTNIRQYFLILKQSWKWNKLEKWEVDFAEAILCRHAASHCTSKSFEMKIERRGKNKYNFSSYHAQHRWLSISNIIYSSSYFSIDFNYEI